MSKSPFLSFRSRPKKKLLDVYRAVFSIRREVFNNRPVADSNEEISAADTQRFQSCCNMVCFNLMFLTCLVDAAMPEESGMSVSACVTMLLVHIKIIFSLIHYYISDPVYLIACFIA